MNDLIFSFFKELNSATNKNMISLAIIIGLVSGFLPTFTPINYIIFFIVLLFRIPIGLYIASFTVSKLFSYLLDPLFNHIGYFILTHFKTLWIYLYNLPLIRWSNFNNTLVMGSLVSGIIIGILLYPIFSKLIDKYRKNVFPKIKQIKFLKWIVPDEEKKGLIRISGVIGIGIIIGLISFLMIVLLNPLVKLLLTYSLSKTLHKNVYIESVNTNILKGSIEIKNMHIDKFLIKKIYAKLHTKNLLWKKLDISTLEIFANTNSPLLHIINPNYKHSNNQTFKLPNIKIPKAQNILKQQHLKSLSAIKKFELDYQQFENYYQTININSYTNETKQIKKEITELKNFKIHSPDDLTILRKKVSSIKSKIITLKNKIKNQKEKLQKYKKLLLNDLKNIQTASKEDYKTIEQQFILFKKGNFTKLSEIYLKPEINKYISIIDKIITKIKPYLKNSQPKTISIPRKGIYIKYPDKILIPDFVLRKGIISLKTSIANYFINIENLSSNQKILNKPALIKIIANSKFYNAYVLIKYLNFITINGKITNIRIKQIKLNKLTIYHPIIDMDFKGTYKNMLKLTANVYFNNAKIQLNKLINKSLSNKFYLKIEIKGKEITINSALDKLISKALQSVIKNKLQKEKQKALQILNKKINNKLKKYNLNTIDIKINKLNNINNSLNQELKQIEKQLIRQEKNKIKNQILNKLKLF